MKSERQEYLTLAEAAQYTGYSPDTLGQYFREGEVPRYGPKRNKFRKVDIDAYMENPQIFRSAQRVNRPKQGFIPVVI